MRDFLTKTMDVWVNQKAAGFMQMDRWAKCGANKDNPFPNTAGCEVIAGLDLSLTTDLTSIAFEIRLPDGRIGVKSHSFMPLDTLEARRRQDRTDYDLWEKQKWITATPGAVVDYDFILDYIDKTYQLNHWAKGEIGFDRYLATWLTQQLTTRGYIPADIAQGPPTLSYPTKNFRDEVYKGNVIHENNPVLSWAMGNAVTKPCPNENIMLDKEHSTERIDPAASLINAHVRFVVKSPQSVYSHRGMRSLL